MSEELKIRRKLLINKYGSSIITPLDNFEIEARREERKKVIKLLDNEIKNLKEMYEQIDLKTALITEVEGLKKQIKELKP